MSCKHDALAPIHTLPAETLATIFVDAATTWQEHASSFVISHVCRHWRNTALSLPALWARIHICSTSETLEIIELLIERSQSHPLDILIHLNKWQIHGWELGESDSDEETSNDHYNTLRNQMALVSVTVSRWRKLAIYDATHHLYSRVLGHLENAAAPTLETLDVQCHADIKGIFEGSIDFGRVFEFFHGGAPKLREIAVRGLSCYVPRCPSLAELRLDDLDFSHAYWQIEQLPSLVELHLTGETLTLHGHEGPVISLPHLRSLRVQLWEDHIISLVHSLQAPALEHFHVDLHNIDADGDTWTGSLESALISAHHSPFPVLQSLTLCYAQFSSLAAETIIAKLPSVKHVSLFHCEKRTPVWQCLLTPVDGVGIPWPQLETISLSTYEIREHQSQPREDQLHPSELEFLHEIVTDRIAKSTPLSSVTFDSHTLKLGTLKEQLESLKRTGVSVQFRDAEHLPKVSELRSDTNTGLCCLSY